MSCPPHPPWFNYPNNIRWRRQAMKITLCNFLHDPSSFLLGPNILLNTLFSNTLSLCSSLKVKDQFSHPYSTTGKITVLYILKLSFLIWDGKTKDIWLNDSKHSLNLNYSWFHHECHSDLLLSSPSIWIFPPFQTIHQLSLYSGSVLCSDDWGIIIYFTFSAFICRPTSLLASKSVSVFYLWYLYHRPTN
jgi:hypothetical protein